MSYGNTNKNPAICDVCGQKWFRRQLKYQVINAKPTRTLACPDCWDEDNPQLQVGRLRVSDPKPIQEPRPDINFPFEAGFTWNPIGGTGYVGDGLGLTMQMWPQTIINPNSTGTAKVYSTRRGLIFTKTSNSQYMPVVGF